MYVKDEVIIWFQDGVLNPNYLGCEIFAVTGGDKVTTELPLNTDFIYSQEIVDALNSIGVAEMKKLIPSINPCIDTISTAKNGRTLWMPHFWNAIVVKFSQEQNIPEIAFSFLWSFSNTILWAQPNFKYEPGGGEGDNFIPIEFQKHKQNSKVTFQKFPNDSLWIYGNNFMHQSQKGYTYVDSAWTLEKGDSSIRIGVCDGGFNPQHPDLGGLPIGSNQRIKGGWNYIESINGPNVLPNGQTAVHGTLVTGVIGATSNNTIGIPGIAGGDSLTKPGTSLYSLVANSTRSIAAAVWEGSARTGLTPATTGSGNRWECDILNFCIKTASYAPDTVGVGGSADELLRAMMGFSYQNGVTSFAAMGDAAKEHLMEDHDTIFCMYPQDVDPEWVVAVSNNTRGVIDNTCDYGKNLDILSPAGGWTTSYDVSSGKHGYLPLSQTSGATPVVSGVAGLLLSLHKKEYPQRRTALYDSIPQVLYPDDVEWLLKHSAQHRYVSRPHDYETAWGVIDADSTLRRLRYPYILRQFSGTFTGTLQDPGKYDTLSIVFPGWRGDTAHYDPLKNGDNTYQVKRYHLVQRVSYGETFSHVERAWGRGGNDETGYGWPLKLRKAPFRLPLYRVGYCVLAEENAFDSSGCVLETNVYEAWKIRPGLPDRTYVGWIPCHPSQVIFTGSVLAQVDSTVTEVENPIVPGDFRVEGPFPNPATISAYMKITCEHPTSVFIEVLDVFGRILQRMDNFPLFQQGTHIIDIPLRHSGIRFIRLSTSDNYSIIRKLRIVR